MSSVPPLDEQESVVAKPRRPRYLVIAVLVALVFRAGCWTDGCPRHAFYRTDVDLGGPQNAVLRDEANRARADDMYQTFLDAANRQKGRAVPLAAATFVLGAALLALGSRSLSGRINTRKLLIQLVAAQAIVVGASFFALRDMQRAELEWQLEKTLMLQSEQMPPEDFARVAPPMRAAMHGVPPTWLAMRTLASLLVILALTRPRARAFFDSVDVHPITE